MENENILIAQCSICGNEEKFELTDEELDTFYEYSLRGREMGMLQDIFPRVPAWIRSCCIDKYSGGFCICPKCSGM